MIIKSLKIKDDAGPRNYLNGQPLAHFVWNHYHPNNKWEKGYHIHHKDEDTLNDWHENLDKLTSSKHSSLHHTGKMIGEDNPMCKIDFTGQSNPFYGKKHSEESKQKMASVKLGRKLSDETKKKMSECHKGEKHHFFGKHHLEETKKKISETKKGSHQTEETKKKRSESIKKWWDIRKWGA